MNDLRPCDGCRRHVSLDEVVCPFCQMDLAPAAPPVLPRGRLSRAAVFAGAALAASAGCGGKAKPVDTHNTAPTADAGVEPDAAVAKQPDPDQRQMPMPYGAPPARRRVV